MRANDDERLAVVGAFIRAARRARGITQQKAAREANVSRGQLALLEKGQNVSVKFLLRIARYLGLTTIPLDGSVELVSGRNGLNVFELIRITEIFGALVDHLRAFAADAVLPPSELRDAPAVDAFIARHAADPESLAVLERAMARLATTSTAAKSPKSADVAPTRKRARKQSQ